MIVVVGLGNFGDRYAYTYHNLGYLAVEALGEALNLKFKRRECDCITARGFVGGEEVILAKPLTFMNLSGRAVYQLMRKFGAEITDFYIIFDDIDIEKGKIRIRDSGSGGTHNGMKNIIEVNGTNEFKRIRIGMGPKPEFVPLADYVLSDIPKAERPQFSEKFEEIIAFFKEKIANA